MAKFKTCSTHRKTPRVDAKTLAALKKQEEILEVLVERYGRYRTLGEVDEAGRQLACTTCVLVNIGVNRPDLLDCHWAYFYDPDIVFTGSVDSVAPYLRGADLAVVPLLQGGVSLAHPAADPRSPTPHHRATEPTTHPRPPTGGASLIFPLGSRPCPTASAT